MNKLITRTVSFLISLSNRVVHLKFLEAFLDRRYIDPLCSVIPGKEQAHENGRVDDVQRPTLEIALCERAKGGRVWNGLRTDMQPRILWLPLMCNHQPPTPF